jgi:uncharacterized protein
MTLFDAIQAGDAQRLSDLLAAGADPNELGEGGRTPLMEAAYAGHGAMVRALLAAKADPSIVDDLDEIALMKAATAGHREVMRLLEPFASPEARALALSFFRASHDMFGVSPPPEPGEEPGHLARAVASVGAFVADALGDEAPARRLDRLERAEELKKKR